MARHSSLLTQNLNAAIASLKRFAPYSANAAFPIWKNALSRLRDTQAALELIDAFKPGLVNVLMEAAAEEADVEHGEPHPEIRALIRRYVGPRCIIR